MNTEAAFTGNFIIENNVALLARYGLADVREVSQRDVPLAGKL